MPYNTLTFRNDERSIYYTETPPRDLIGQRYKVCLLRVEDVPQPWVPHDDIYPYTVLCAAQYKDRGNGWAWVALEIETKVTIGLALEDQIKRGAIAAGQWIWMVVIPHWARSLLPDDVSDALAKAEEE